MRRGMTTGWGTKVARAFSAASGAVLVAVLAGCSLGGSTLDGPEAAPSTSTPADTHSADGQPSPAPGDQPAFHFRSGDLVLGDFTYDDVAGNIFNPCEEISAEEFAAIGFEADYSRQPSRQSGLEGCALRPVGPEFNTNLIAGGLADRSVVEEKKTIVRGDASSHVPGLYAFVDESHPGQFCGAAVDTKRGQFGSMVGNISSVDSTEDLCNRAIQIMEDLYQLGK